MREKSRISLSNCISPSADSLAVLKYSRTVGARSALSANSVMPRMAAIGVRSSWLTLARNWSLAALAASAVRACCCEVSSSRSRCMASATWSATVLIISSSSWPNDDVVREPNERVPITWP